MAFLISSLRMQPIIMCQLMIVQRILTLNTVNSTTNDIVLNQSSTETKESPILPEGYVSYPDIGVAYKFYNNTSSWNKAKELCLREGAQLALIDSFKKIKYLKKQRRESYKGVTKYTHVGIHRLLDGDEWISINEGKSITSIPWAPDEPSGNFNCVMVDWGKDGLLNGACHFTGSTYVCELPIPISNGKNG